MYISKDLQFFSLFNIMMLGQKVMGFLFAKKTMML